MFFELTSKWLTFQKEIVLQVLEVPQEVNVCMFRDGQLVVESCRTRSVFLNKADCVDKLRTAILDLVDSERSKEVGVWKETEREIAARNARARLIDFNKAALKQSNSSCSSINGPV